MMGGNDYAQKLRGHKKESTVFSLYLSITAGEMMQLQILFIFGMIKPR